MKKVTRTAGVVAALMLAAGTSAYAAGGQLSGESISATGVTSTEDDKPGPWEIWVSLQTIICDQLDVTLEKIVLEAKFKEDLGADSLDMVEICMKCEEEFEIEIPYEDLEHFKTVVDLYDYILVNTM